MSEMSKSKKKRIEQENRRNAQRRRKVIATFWKIFIPLLIIAAIVVGILIYQRSKLDYSRYLTKTGALTFDASDHVTVNTDAMKFVKSELLPEDSVVDNEIESDLSSHESVSEDKELLSSFGDKVSITYTSTIDGAEYKNVTDATSYTIGSADIDDAFDDALADHAPGDDIEATVEFPEDYEDETAAGKTAQYRIHLIGIYQKPELNDEYVKTYHSDVASTVAEYRQSIIDEHYNDSLGDKIDESLSQNSVVKSVPKGYLHDTIQVLKKLDEDQLQYMNNLYQQIGYGTMQNVYEMGGFENMEQYEADVEVRAREQCERAMELQYIADRDGISITQDEVRSHYKEEGYEDENFAELEKTYGFGYLARSVLEEKILEHLRGIVNVE